jgi:hypothetical protein
MSNHPTRADLIEELENDGETFFTGGFWCNITDLSLTVVTVLASLAATVLASSERGSIARWILATVAAIPAGATSLLRIIGIRERSNWYFFYAAQVRSLATKLKYAASPDIEEFANKRAELEVEMEKEWLKVGRSGAAPSGRSKGHAG